MAKATQKEDKKEGIEKGQESGMAEGSMMNRWKLVSLRGV